eukprot:6089838-Prymnesium_polylepis.1
MLLREPRDPPQHAGLLAVLQEPREPGRSPSQQPPLSARVAAAAAEARRPYQVPLNLRQQRLNRAPSATEAAAAAVALAGGATVVDATTALAGSPHPKCPIALLFSGGARDVHMTGPSIMRNLIQPLGASRVCLFIRALLDPDAHKLDVLLNATSVRVAGLHLGPVVIPPAERAHATSVLQGQGQRVLEESQQLEDVQELVEAFERARGVDFRLVVRARLDSFWSAPVHLAKLSRAMEDGVYVVPRGKAFRGLNDRFG